MISETTSIPSELISEEEIKQKLPSIFVDSIVVDQRFNIFVVSQNVLEMLEFTNEQLKDKNINYIAGHRDISTELKEKLKFGFSEEIKITVYNKSSRGINIGISGFYLGLVSDINGYIILKVRNLDEVGFISEQLEQKKIELDKFIYRAAHDLRGPLATIKGLVNLMKMRQDNLEVDRMVQLLDDHANKMDQRLFQLVYLAQADHETELPTHVVNFKAIEATLRMVVEQNSCTDFLELLFMAPERKVVNFNEVLLKNLLSNFLLHLLSLPKATMKGQAFFRLEQTEDSLRITVGAVGFEVSDTLKKAMHQAESIYTDVINYPQLINFYAAQKITWQLNATMQVHFLSEQKHKIIITIPVNKENQLSMFAG